MIRQLAALSLGVIAAAALWPASVAMAAVKDWTDGTGNWSTPANWSGATAPVNDDLVNLYFTDGVARTITYNIPAITLGSMNVSLKGPGTANATLSIAANNLTSGTEYIGYDGRGTIDQSGGMNTISAGGGTFSVGVLFGSTGTYNLSGTGTLIANTAESVGDSGTGVFNQTGGTNSATVRLEVGSGGTGNGTYNLSNGNLFTDNEFVGNMGNGTMNQTGGTNTVMGDLDIGVTAGRTGTYTLSAGSASIAGGAFVGGNAGGGGGGGTGVLTVSGTGVLDVSVVLKVHNTVGSSLNLSGGTINSAALNFGGVLAHFNWTSGKLNLTQSVTWDSAAAASSTSGAFGSSLVLGSNQTLMVTGNETLGGAGAFSLALNSGSAHDVTGGLTVNPAGSITINPGSTLICPTFTQAGGAVNGTLLNQTAFIYQSGAFNGRLLNQGTVSFGSSFTAGNGIENHSPITVAVGQTLTANGAGLDNLSEFIVNGSATATTFTNSGLLHGTGQLTAPVINATSGDVRVVAGERLRFAGTSFTNQGLVEAIGGAASSAEVEFNSPVINSTANGLIAGSNSLYRFNSGLTNQASFALSIGTNNVLGDITNSVTGKIVVSGGAGATFYDDIVQNGTFRVSKVGSTTSVAVVFGAFSGSGGSTGGGDIFFEGDLRPGNSPATVSFDNNIGFGGSATVDFELGGTTAGSQYDQVHVTGALALGGTLKIDLVNLGIGLFAPAAGDSFDLLDWGTLSGTFSAIQLPALGGALTWNTSQLYTSGVLSVVSAGLPGDYNNNGIVDAADYVLWRKNNNTAVTLPNDSTAATDQTDYAVWRAHFGQTAGSGSGANTNAAIPEPATVLMLILVVAGWCLSRHQGLHKVPTTQ